jgi:hypothetical protein
MGTTTFPSCREMQAILQITKVGRARHSVRAERGEITTLIAGGHRPDVSLDAFWLRERAKRCCRPGSPVPGSVQRVIQPVALGSALMVLAGIGSIKWEREADWKVTGSRHKFRRNCSKF